MDLTRHTSSQLPTRSWRGRRVRDVLIEGTVRWSCGWAPRAISRQVFGHAPRKHGGSSSRSTLPLEDEHVFAYSGVMVSCPSPTSRSGRCLGVRHRGGPGVVRALVRRLIARAMALGRPGLLGQTRELAEDVARAGSSVPSKARPTLVGMDRTPHLERLAAPAKAVPLADFVHRLRAWLAGSPRARVARARHTVDLVDLAAAVTCRMTPTPTNHGQTSRARDALWRPCRHQHPRRGAPRQAPGDRAHHLHQRKPRPRRRARHDHEEFTAFMAEYRPLPPTRRSGLTMSSATSDT